MLDKGEVLEWHNKNPEYEWISFIHVSGVSTNTMYKHKPTGNCVMVLGRVGSDKVHIVTITPATLATIKEHF